MVLAFGKYAALTSLLLVLSTISTLVRSQAPGDSEGQTCDKNAVPDGVVRLLDAGWYATLLSGGTNAAGWTQTPDDSWSGEGSHCTRRLVSDCDVSNAWVATQYINKTAVVNYTMEIIVDLEGDSSTSGTVKVHYYPSSGPIRNNAQLNRSNYSPAGSLSYAPASSEQTVTFSLGSQYDRFYIAVEDDSDCFTLRGLKVSYEVCHSDPVGLVVYPNTPISASAVTTSAQCKDNAIVTPGSTLSITCNADGTYSGSPSCSCGGGHFESGDMCHPCAANFFALPGDGTCTQCPPNSHSSQGASECDCDPNYTKISFNNCQRVCPDNSVSQQGSDECTCLTGYYRTSKESSTDPCTKGPTKPRSLTSVLSTETSVTLMWTKPMDDGGRPRDLFYTIKYKTVGGVFKYYTTSTRINSTSAIVSGLNPRTTYVFAVVANNNVTEEFPSAFPAANRTSDEITISTMLPSGPGKPTNLTAASHTNSSVSLSWNPPPTNGGLGLDVFYTIYYKTTGCDFVEYTTSSKITATSVTVSGLSPMTTYTFVVVAGNDATEKFPNVFPLSNASSRTSDELTVSTKPSFEIVNLVILWRPTLSYGGGILGYNITVKSKAGTPVFINKKPDDFYHQLTKEDIPANVTGMPHVILKLTVVTEQGLGEWSTEKTIPVDVLIAAGLISPIPSAEPRITFINDSPIVDESNVTMHLATNRDVSSLQCRLVVPNKLQKEELEVFQDCSSRIVTYTDLPSATYKFQAVAELMDGSQLFLERKFRPDTMDECNVHLINDGVTVTGNSAVVEFAFTGFHAKCKLPYEDFKPCTSPHRMDNLSSGTFFFKITPLGCTNESRYPLKIHIEIP